MSWCNKAMVVTEVRENSTTAGCISSRHSNEFHALKQQVNAGVNKAKTKKYEMNQWEQLAY